jgi:hypothetical protein
MKFKVEEAAELAGAIRHPKKYARGGTNSGVRHKSGQSGGAGTAFPIVFEPLAEAATAQGDDGVGAWKPAESLARVFRLTTLTRRLPSRGYEVCFPRRGFSIVSERRRLPNSIRSKAQDSATMF